MTKSFKGRVRDHERAELCASTAIQRREVISYVLQDAINHALYFWIESQQRAKKEA